MGTLWGSDTSCHPLISAARRTNHRRRSFVRQALFQCKEGPTPAPAGCPYLLELYISRQGLHVLRVRWPCHQREALPLLQRERPTASRLKKPLNPKPFNAPPLPLWVLCESRHCSPSLVDATSMDPPCCLSALTCFARSSFGGR